MAWRPRAGSTAGIQFRVGSGLELTCTVTASIIRTSMNCAEPRTGLHRTGSRALSPPGPVSLWLAPSRIWRNWWHAAPRRKLLELDRPLAQLSPQQQQVILLVGLEGMSYEETAEILAIPVGTVRSRLSLGRDFFAGSWIWRSAVLRQHRMATSPDGPALDFRARTHLASVCSSGPQPPR